MFIACASAAAYLITVTYEYGYCAYFQLPAALINPSLSTVLLAAAAIGGVLFSSLKMMGLSAPLLRAARNPTTGTGLRVIFSLNAMFLMVGVLVLGSYGFALQGAAIFLGLVVAFNLIAIAPVFFADKKMPYREHFQRLEHTEDRLDLPVLMDDWFGRGWMITFLALVGMLALAYTVGHGEASRKERYLTLKEAPDTVVLRTYGDVFISARFDRATKEMSNDIVLMWHSEKKQTEFRNELIGPLVLAKPPVPKTIAPAAKTKSTASAPQLAS